MITSAWYNLTSNKFLWKEVKLQLEEVEKGSNSKRMRIRKMIKLNANLLKYRLRRFLVSQALSGILPAAFYQHCYFFDMQLQIPKIIQKHWRTEGGGHCAMASLSDIKMKNKKKQAILGGCVFILRSP